MGKYIDLTGQKFGMLTVQERVENKGKNRHPRYLCHCDCGKKLVVRSDRLLSGEAICCGCLYKINLSDWVGKKFGMLTVIQPGFYPDGENRPSYPCICDCGNKVIVKRGRLLDGSTKSCGCMGHHSMGEKHVYDFLLKNNINFKKEFSFNNLYDKEKLRFDFVIFNTWNYPIKCIEVQGRQHYDKNDHFYKESTNMHDEMKRVYCKNNKLKLLELDYRLGQEKTNFTIWDNQLIQFLCIDKNSKI